MTILFISKAESHFNLNPEKTAPPEASPGSIVHKKEVGGYGTAMATDGKMSERVICDTFLRYKGLERSAIIVTDLQHGVEQYSIRMNIAVSRAYGVLRVVVPRRELEKDKILLDISCING